MPEPLLQALAELRVLILDAEHLVRAVGAGRRRGAQPAHARVELRPVELKAGARLQLVSTDGRQPLTRNLVPGEELAAAVDALLAEPFGSWHVETDSHVVQLRVTKKGQAQVHRQSRDAVQAPPRSHNRVRQHLLDPGDRLFTALGAGAAKRRQVDAFLRLLEPVAQPAALRAREQERPLRVVDLGCGNAYLTFAAHRYLGEQLATRTLGVDIRPATAARNTALAGELGMSGLRFVAGSIADTDGAGEPDADGAGGQVDVVLALHACDTATDDALAWGVRRRAPVLLAAPCCHHDIQRQLAAGGGPGAFPALTRDAILRERFADVLTDALRAALLRLLGYRVDVVEFVESRHTPRNAMLRAVRTGRPPDAAVRAGYAALVGTWRVRPVLADRLADQLADLLDDPLDDLLDDLLDDEPPAAR